MKNCKQLVSRIQCKVISSEQVSAPVTGKTNRLLLDKLVYGTRLANDHIYHELEARYGDVMAQWLMEQMPS